MNLKFWKKDDLALPELSNTFSRSELGLKDNSGLDLSSQFEPSQMMPQGMAPPPPMPSMPSAFSQSAPFPPPRVEPQFSPPEPAADHSSKDLEIIAAKLDTIRAQLDMLNTRMANLEHQSQAPPKRPWY